MPRFTKGQLVFSRVLETFHTVRCISDDGLVVVQDGSRPDIHLPMPDVRAASTTEFRNWVRRNTQKRSSR